MQMGMVTRLPSGLDPGYLPVFHSSPSTSNTDSVSIGSIATVTTAATRAEVIDTGDVEDRGGGGEGHEESSRCQVPFQAPPKVMAKQYLCCGLKTLHSNIFP